MHSNVIVSRPQRLPLENPVNRLRLVVPAVHSIVLSVLCLFAVEYRVAAQTGGSIPAGRDGIETGAVSAHDISVTKTDGVTTVTAGTSTTYVITAVNAGPSGSGGNLTDAFPPALTCSWTCVASAGSSCPASGSGDINAVTNLLSGGTATFTVPCTISASASGTLVNTATLSTLGDTNPANDSATDSDSIISAVPLMPPMLLLTLALILLVTGAMALRRRSV